MEAAIGSPFSTIANRCGTDTMQKNQLINPQRKTFMKKRLLLFVTIAGIAALGQTRAFSDDLETLAGKWTAQTTNEDGQRYTQQIEIKKSKFTYKIIEPDGGTRLYAEGDMKLGKT